MCQLVQYLTGLNYITCSSLSFFSLFFKSRPPYQVEQKKKGGGCARGWCVRRGSLLQDRLPVKFQDVKKKLSELESDLPQLTTPVLAKLPGVLTLF